jgi:hypothetical protein
MPIANTISGITTAFTEIFTWILARMGELVSLVLAQPLLFIPIGVVATYMLIKLFRRLF